MKRCALYVRVSTDEQKKHGLSVDSQIVALRDYCKQNDLQEVGLYNDAGISARKSYKKRPALLQLIEDCERGLIDVILFTKLDRWFRSVADYYEVQTRLDACHVPWRAIWEDYETETSSGVFKVNIMLSVAQSEADRTSERIKSVFDYKRAQGDYVGTPPYGYKRVDKRLVKDETVAPLVELMFKTYLMTYSSTRTMEALQAVGYNVNMNAMRKRLKNPIYAGDMNGFACPAYITAEDHQKIIDNMSQYIRTPKGGINYIFSGLMICGYCGNRMGAKSSTNQIKTGKVRCKYYVCDGKTYATKHEKRLTISERKVEKYLLDQIATIISEYNINLSNEEKKSDAKDKRKALEQKLERVGIRFEVGDLSVDEYKEKRELILRDISDLDRMMSDREPIILDDNWKETYIKLDDIHKRAFWRSFISSIEVLPDKTLNIKIGH